MHRGIVALTVLILSSLACGVVGTATPITTLVSTPIEVVSTPTNTQNPSIHSTATQIPDAAGTSAPTEEEQTKTPYPTSVLDNQMTRQIDQIQSQVIEERGLQPVHTVPVILLSPDELRQNVTNDFLADYSDEEMTDDMMELSTIGLIDPDFDMKAFYTELLSEQVAGYYDNDTQEMFVVQGQGFEGPEHLTYAHEFTHVLQDQNFDIKNGLNYNDDACEKNSERCAAIQALVEGDASLSEFTWFQNSATTQDQKQVVDFYNTMTSPVYDSAPAFLKDDFVFPYYQGLTFVQEIFFQGGWSAVNAVYKNPPVSTEQILHPEKYPSDTPIPVELPDLTSVLGSGWRKVSHNQMGEWYTYLILARAADANARLDDTTAQNAAAGWGGDEYQVLHNDATNQTAFVMKTIWDTPNDAGEFARAFQQYGNRQFGVTGTQQGDTFSWSYSGGYSSLYQSGDTTIWINAPNSATAEAVAGSVQP